MNSTWRLLIVVTALLSVCGCGSDSTTTDGTASSQPTALNLNKVDSPVAQCLGRFSAQGVEGTGFTRKIQGVLTVVGDGSVTVAGIAYDATHAVVLVNGVCVTLSDLHVGTTVTVDGTVDDATLTGTAYVIYSSDSVVGGIDSLDAAAGTLSVNGQPIVVSPTTVFGDDIEPGQIDTLKQYNMIAVSGSMQPDGTLSATRIQRWPTSAVSGVAGIVTSVDADRHLLYVGGVEVLYDEAALVNFQNDIIRTGDYVRALGYPLVVRAGFSGPGIAAWAVQRVALPVSDPKDDIVISGAVSYVRGGDDFDVMGQPVKMTAATVSATHYGSGQLGARRVLPDRIRFSGSIRIRRRQGYRRAMGCPVAHNGADNRH